MAANPQQKTSDQELSGALYTLRDFSRPMVNLDGASVMVTGGTGSFGNEFVKAVLKRFKPRRLIIFSRDELKQYEMAQRFSQEEYPCMRYFIGDVRDRDRLDIAMRDVDYVIHAAALKHVPIAEYNPFECIRTNVMGAENVVAAAIRQGVKKVVALSTDKAANPINLYGASKLASDKIFVAGNNLAGADGSRFAVVRYGNVIGSRGSVIPFFKKLIAEGADALPITDERMTRFWITLDQGVDFVLSSLEAMRGGEIYIPKIPSTRMIDLAESLAPDLPRRIVGIRPGEKLHEVMVPADDSRMTVELADRYVILPTFASWEKREELASIASPVEDGFEYNSNTNPECLDARSLQQFLKTCFPSA